MQWEHPIIRWGDGGERSENKTTQTQGHTHYTSMSRPKHWDLHTSPYADRFPAWWLRERSWLQFYKASGVMISCPGKCILSVSHMMRSLYMGHKFHSLAQATTIHVMSGFITYKQITSLNSYCPKLTAFECTPAFYRLILWSCDPGLLH